MKSIFRKACCLMMCSSMIFSMAGCGADKDEVDPEVTPGQSQTEGLETNQPDSMVSEQSDEELPSLSKNYITIQKLNDDLIGFQIDGEHWDIYSRKDGFMKTLADTNMFQGAITQNILSFYDSYGKMKYVDDKGNDLTQYTGKKVKQVCKETMDGKPVPYELFAVLNDKETDSGYVTMYEIYRSDTNELCYEQKISHEEDPDIPDVVHDGEQFLFRYDVLDEDLVWIDYSYASFPDGKPAVPRVTQPEAKHKDIYMEEDAVDPSREYRIIPNRDWDKDRTGKVNIGPIPILLEMSGEIDPDTNLEIFRLVDANTLQPISDTYYTYVKEVLDNGFLVGDVEFTDLYDKNGKLVKHLDGHFSLSDHDVGEGLLAYTLSGNNRGKLCIMRQDTGEVIMEDNESYSIYAPPSSNLYIHYDADRTYVKSIIFGDGTIREDLTIAEDNWRNDNCHEDYAVFKKKDQPGILVCVDSFTGETLFEVNGTLS